MSAVFWLISNYFSKQLNNIKRSLIVRFLRANLEKWDTKDLLWGNYSYTITSIVSCWCYNQRWKSKNIFQKPTERAGVTVFTYSMKSIQTSPLMTNYQFSEILKSIDKSKEKKKKELASGQNLHKLLMIHTELYFMKLAFYF